MEPCNPCGPCGSYQQHKKTLLPAHSSSVIEKYTNRVVLAME